MITAKCHCGNVSLLVAKMPASVSNCNCSICRRLGALWAYYLADKVEVSFETEKTRVYIWGDKYLEFHHCGICGCCTHHTVTKKYVDEFKEQRVAINFRLLDADVLKDIPLREFKGSNL